MASSRNGVLYTWETWRKISLWVIVILLIFLAVVVSIPLGFLVTVAMVLLSLVWREIGQTTDAFKGEYTPNTLPFRVAAFFMAYRAKYREAFQPIISVGMGPPSEDKDHGLEPGWTPPTRLSSYWSLVGALILASIDYFTASFRFPFWYAWSDFRVPAIVMYVLSALGFYISFQTISHIGRIRADKTGIIGREPAPAVMLSHIRGHVDLRHAAKQSIMFAAIPTVLVSIVWAMTQMSLGVALLVYGILVTPTLLIAPSLDITKMWRQQWAERAARREEWDATLSFLKNPPTYVGEDEFPSLEEHIEMTAHLDEDIPYNPRVKVATFLFPPNSVYEDFLGISQKIRSALSARIVAVAPIGEIDHETGEEQMGTIGAVGFRIWWSEENISLEQAIDPEMDDWSRDLVVRGSVLRAISSIRGLDECILSDTRMMTRKGSEANIMEIKVIPPSNLNLDSFLSKLPAIRDNLGVRWVGIHQEGKSSQDSQKAISLLIGDSPEVPGIRFVNPPRPSRRIIDICNWSYYFHVNGVTGPSGAPRLLERRQSTEVVDQLVFELPKGTPYDRVAGTIERIAETSGNEFIEVSRGSTQGRRVIRNKDDLNKQGEEQSMFTVVAAKKDPLSRGFPWVDYQDRLLTGREKGKPKLSWSPGVLANDEMAWDTWGGGDIPHLLIAGASGMGKSQLAMSMLMQLAYNNSPDELEFHFIEPKNELQTFENIDNCEEMVDSWTPDEDFMFNAAESALSMVNEMNRRYKAMRDHPKKPKKLEKAREIAQREGPRPDGSKHPLDLPYIIFYFEECATMFAEAGSKEEKAEQNRLVAYVAELARKSRAAGIYLAFATQYPTNASIPSVIRNQCRRIGLGCQNRVASDVVIGQPGLEKISTPGLGMFKPGTDYRKFRGYWIKDGDPDHNEQNDIFDVLKMIPTKNVGGIGGTGGAFGAPKIRAPELSDSIFNLWESQTANLQEAVNTGRKTKDNQVAVQVTEDGLTSSGISTKPARRRDRKVLDPKDI